MVYSHRGGRKMTRRLNLEGGVVYELRFPTWDYPVRRGTYLGRLGKWLVFRGGGHPSSHNGYAHYLEGEIRSATRLDPWSGRD